jgi:acetyl-CoA carboxylase carboxyltransferase component/biotin carboxylase
MPVTRLLVANRGEVAARVLHTTSALGLPAVAVCAADDTPPEWADHVERLPADGPAAYLDVEALVAAAHRTGCDAVHPGWGFLAESARFARACADAGLTFVGPSPSALELFGDKAAARARAAELGVPVPPGTGVLEPGDPTATAFLAEHGAVLVKAVAGGGGRGIRAVHDPAELAEAMRRCASEAEHAFGNGAVYLERLLAGARHIEVQLVGDGGGEVRAIGDRDCSLQLHRQKVLEIAPAPGLSDELRGRLWAAAEALGGAVDRLGVATAEFLLAAPEFTFLEVNGRLQVEHTVTEQVSGLDLVAVQLRLAGGATLDDVGLKEPRAAEATAIQARVNAESHGPLTTFAPPTGRGIRVDTHCAPGYPVSPRYDPLLAKVIVTAPDLPAAAALTERALGSLRIDGVDTNVGLLRELARHPDLGALPTGFVDGLAVPEPASTHGDTITAPRAGVVVELPEPGTQVAEGGTVAVLEAMKMEYVVPAAGPVRVREVLTAVGRAVAAGTPLLTVEPAQGATAAAEEDATPDPDHIRTDLAEVLDRQRTAKDEGRPQAVQTRHAKGRRTARENIADLVDPGSFVEYGALTVAAQRRRRELPDLIANTPGDGMVTGTARIGGQRVAVLSYDYTVLAGTQGVQNHRKTDRLLELARREGIPVVIFAEGGGGRPGDTDQPGFTGLDVPTFHTAAQLYGQVPTIGVVSGYCFAGNAALAAVCDVLIGTEGASLGMGGPAMIEGGGLGVVAPMDVGPMPVHVRTGVIDLLVADDAAAVDAARRYVSYLGGAQAPGPPADQRVLRHLIPENRVRAYRIRPILETLFDDVLELRAGFGHGMVTALARLNGHPVGVFANDPGHLGGAIDGDAATKTARFLRVCETYRLPVISLCDTPGFMVGPEAEATGLVRQVGEMFAAGARRTVPLAMVVLRKGYGLGAMAMAGGSLRATVITTCWPTAEFGGMNLEGATRLRYRKELAAIDDEAERQAEFEQLVARQYEHGKALSTATAFDVDDVIDPADTRAVLTAALGLD